MSEQPPGVASVPRPEYPRPQFVRADWLSLNGEWEFEIDTGDDGLDRDLHNRPLARRITVPFCPESDLSGVGERGFLEAVWYRRTVTIPEGWRGRHVLLHFQAVDYDTTVWIDGIEAGRHRGGFTPFTFDLGDRAGETIAINLRARDPSSGPQPRGKQSTQLQPSGSSYTRTTGIWQPVWLEPVPVPALGRARITPDLGTSTFWIEQPFRGQASGLRLRVTLSDAEGTVTSAETGIADFSARLALTVPPGRRRLWDPDDPHLYGLALELVDGADACIDRLESYAGLRSVTFDGPGVCLNGRPLFQRLVLDQGYYPDGVMTAPTDGALSRDIALAKAAGFNGARLHEKVFEERFLYHADRLGYLVWGEFGDWGWKGDGTADGAQHPGATYIAQWLEALDRDYSHPSIVGWCPLNESGQEIGDTITALDDATCGLFLATKALDSTRPVLDASGWSHRVVESDVYDCHDYESDPERFAANHGSPFVNLPRRSDASWSVPYRGQPFFVSEFGGTLWSAGGDPDAWGQPKDAPPASFDEAHERIEALMGVLLDNPRLFGYCYTQLTDILTEQNGIYAFDRSPKLDVARIRAAQMRPAAIEGSSATECEG